MTEQEFIPYELALELKQLGFDEECFGYYGISDEDTEIVLELRQTSQEGNLAKKVCSAPTYSQAFRWFRQQHNLKSWIQEHTTDTFIYEIRPHVLIHYREDETYVYTGYEEAELACLRKLIEIVKKGGNK